MAELFDILTGLYDSESNAPSGKTLGAATTAFDDNLNNAPFADAMQARIQSTIEAGDYKFTVSFTAANTNAPDLAVMRFTRDGGLTWEVIGYPGNTQGDLVMQTYVFPFTSSGETIDYAIQVAREDSISGVVSGLYANIMVERIN